MAATKKRKDGRYLHRFSVEGKRFFVYGKTEKECREKEAKKRAELAAGLYKRGKDLTIEEYFSRWIAARGDVKETTIRTNRILLNAINNVHIDKAGRRFGDLRLTKIEPQNIRDLQTALRTGRKTRTVNDSIALLRSVLDSAVTERIIPWNPAAGIRNIKRVEPAAKHTIHRALTIKETNAFLSCCGDSWYRELFIFLLNTGCRIGEAGALLEKDISGGAAHISKTLTRTENGGYIVGAETKTASGKRSIPLNKAASKAIQSQKRKNGYSDRVIGINENRGIFRAVRGGLIKDSAVNEEIARICAAAGIEKFTVHAFRDTFATRCVESGMQPKTLQEIIGHSNIAITMGLYVHVMSETKIEQLNAVSFV